MKICISHKDNLIKSEDIHGSELGIKFIINKTKELFGININNYTLDKWMMVGNDFIIFVSDEDFCEVRDFRLNNILK